MLTKEERLFVHKRAYLPEHLPHYVSGISGEEPFVHRNCLCFFGKGHLTFVGFPLKEEGVPLASLYESACERFSPETVSVIAPEIWLNSGSCERHPPDSYYRLDLPFGKLRADLAYMLRRAKRELRIAEGRFGRHHKRLIKEFLKNRSLSPTQVALFKRVPKYLKISTSSHLLEAWKGKDLVAFTILDTGSADYGFYLFHFRSKQKGVPGTSDLLFYEMLHTAQSLGKEAINLGLGINEGIRRFKEKWGGRPFLRYASAMVHNAPPKLGDLGSKL